MINRNCIIFFLKDLNLIFVGILFYHYLSYIGFAACVPGYFDQFCNKFFHPGKFGDKCGGHSYPKCTKIYCHHVAGFQNTNYNISMYTLWKWNNKYSHSRRPVSII